jgi:LysR family transcriptional regulator, hydrogen peroxide-inducible genes activator
VNLRDFKYLIALADTRHFGKAAEKTFVSQPTLSAQLKKLEDHLGVTLIERHTRQVTLTDIGLQIVARARRVIQETEDLVKLAESSRDPLAGMLRIAFIPTLGPYLLPRITHKLREALPKAQIMLYEYQTEPMVKAVETGALDVGILALGVDIGNLEQRALGDEHFVVALPNQHRRAAQTEISRDDLNGETILLLEDGHCLRDQALEVCSKLEIHESGDFRATSLETLRQMVAAGYGITLLPELSTGGPFALQTAICTRPFKGSQPHRVIGSVWRKSTTRQTAIKVISDIIAADLKTLPKRPLGAGKASKPLKSTKASRRP